MAIKQADKYLYLKQLSTKDYGYAISIQSLSKISRNVKTKKD